MNNNNIDENKKNRYQQLITAGLSLTAILVTFILLIIVKKQTTTINTLEKQISGKKENINEYLTLDVNFDNNKKIDDKSKNNLQATIESKPEGAAGINGQAILLDGVDDMIFFPNTTDKFENGDHTIAFWTKNLGQQATSDQYIVDHYNWSFFWTSDIRLDFKVGRMNNSTGTVYRAYTIFPQSQSDWIFVTGVYSPTNKEIALFINGKRVNANNIGSDQIFTNYGPQNLMIGYSQHTTKYYHGLIDDLKIYNKALTDREIDSLYQQYQTTSKRKTWWGRLWQ